MTKAIRLFARSLALVCFAIVAFVNAQQPANAPLTGAEVMVPMRDGVRLYTQVYTPTQAAEKLPILFLRTPYGAGALNPQRIATALPELMADGYIIVSQDIRGRFKSEGQFVMLRQPRDPQDKKCPYRKVRLSFFSYTYRHLALTVNLPLITIPLR
jgi:uncharacterized protein